MTRTALPIVIAVTLALACTRAERVADRRVAVGDRGGVRCAGGTVSSAHTMALERVLDGMIPNAAVMTPAFA